VEINFSKRAEKVAEIAGYVGMLLIHAATLPTTLYLYMGWSTNKPPLSMVLLVWIGLILFLWRAVVRWDWLYIISNFIGFVANSILLILIVYR
jgi:hypothetical protein